MVFGAYNLTKIVKDCENNGWNLEFSSGLPYISEANEIFIKSKIQKIAHNYFPAPKTPFILNLGSSNDEIRSKSILHCKQGLNLVKKTRGPFFSAHAGFCIDPSPEMLGGKFIYKSNIDRDLNKKQFIKSLKEISDYAMKINMLFLFENNVLTIDNKNKTIPLLCCESNEIIEILNEIDSNHIGLLLDTGHLKVSCNTLKKNLEEEFMILKNYVYAIHHSDNDSLNDQNRMLDDSYWFWKFCKFFKENINVLEVKCNSNNDIQSQIDLFLKNGIK